MQWMPLLVAKFWLCVFNIMFLYWPCILIRELIGEGEQIMKELYQMFWEFPISKKRDSPVKLFICGLH